MGRFLCCLERGGPALCFDSADREQSRVGLPRSKLYPQTPLVMYESVDYNHFRLKELGCSLGREH